MVKGQIETDNLPKTGYTKATPNFYMLNAGAMVENLAWTAGESGGAGKWSYDRIGATSGGNKLTLKNEYRQVQVDGVMAKTVGSDQIESTEGTFEINALELTSENFKRMLLAETVDDAEVKKLYPDTYDIIRPTEKIGATAYVKNLAYIGTVQGSELPIIIIMHNAICTSGLEIEPKDGEDIIIPMTFEARAGEDDIENAALPITILYPKGVGTDAAAGKQAAMNFSSDTSDLTDEE